MSTRATSWVLSMSMNEAVGYALILGGFLDLALAEIPRLISSKSQQSAMIPTFQGTTVLQSGIIGALFDVVIMYGGARLMDSQG